jgi:hypothetical protein
LVVVILLNRFYYKPKFEKEIKQMMREWSSPEKEKGMDFKYRGVIWLLSPNKDSLKIARYGIGQHKEKGKLEVCWCIYGSEYRDVEKGLVDRMGDLESELKDFFGDSIKIKRRRIPKPDAHHTFEAVNDIYQEDIKKYGLEPHEVVADITGGFASMSAGMAIACSLLKVPMEYIQVEWKKVGDDVVPSTQVGTWRHVLIDPTGSNSVTEGETS